MTRHVPPHRWADLMSGRVNAARGARWERHANQCPRCAQQREQIRRVRRDFSHVAALESPSLSWDKIAAAAYWDVTRGASHSEANASGPTHRRAVWAAAVALPALVAGLWMWFAGSPHRESVPPQHSASAASDLSRVGLPDDATAIRGVVTLLHGSVVDGKGESIDFEGPVAAGAVFASQSGRLTVQFGDDSGFSLGPNSTLALRRFDSRRIELEVTGVVDVDIARRGPEQEFVIAVGRHQVWVRGTAFRVSHNDDSVNVTCVRGKVVVSDGAAKVDVGAGEQFRLLKESWTEGAMRSVPLTKTEVAQMEAALRVLLLPKFSAAGVPGRYSRMDIRSTREVAVDGMPVGRGPVLVRVAPGEHWVATAGDSGEWSEPESVVVAPGARSEIVVTSENRSGAEGLRIRRGELRSALQRNGRAERCLAPLAKQGLAEGSFVVFELGVSAAGTQEYLNVADSNLSPALQQCLRQVVDSIRLQPGPSAHLRYRLEF